MVSNTPLKSNARHYAMEEHERVARMRAQEKKSAATAKTKDDDDGDDGVDGDDDREDVKRQSKEDAWLAR